MSNPSSPMPENSDTIIDIIPVIPESLFHQDCYGSWCSSCCIYCFNTFPTTSKETFDQLVRTRSCFNLWRYISVFTPLIGGFLGTLFGIIYLWSFSTYLSYIETIIVAIVAFISAVSIHLQPVFLNEIRHLANAECLKGKIKVYIGNVPLTERAAQGRVPDIDEPRQISVRNEPHKIHDGPRPISVLDEPRQIPVLDEPRPISARDAIIVSNMISEAEKKAAIPRVASGAALHVSRTPKITFPRVANPGQDHN